MPTVTRTNLCTNPSFEAAITGWSAFGTTLPTVARSTLQSSDRTASLLITYGTNASSIQGPQITIAGLTSGQQYTASAMVYTPAGGARLVIAVAGIGLGSASSTTIGIWSRVSITWTATASSHLLQFWVPSGGTTSGQQAFLDAVLVEQSPLAAAYFDGASSGCVWTGTADLSTSQQLSGPLQITASNDLVNEPPRNALFVSGAPGTTVQVTRTDPDGNIRPVRGGDPGTLINGQWPGYDYEMPYGQSVIYTAIPSDGSASAFTTATPLATTQSRLIHPGIPALSMKINGVNRTDRSYAGGSAEHVILGAQYPKTQTDGARKSGKFTLTLRTKTSAENSAITAILAGCVPLLLQLVFPYTTSSAWHYINVNDVTAHEVTRVFGDPKRVWTLECTIVDRPAGGLAAQRTYADVLSDPGVGTYADLTTRYKTYTGLLTGVAGT